MMVRKLSFQFFIYARGPAHKWGRENPMDVRTSSKVGADARRQFPSETYIAKLLYNSFYPLLRTFSVPKNCVTLKSDRAARFTFLLQAM